MKIARSTLGGAAIAALAFTLAGCAGGTSGGTSGGNAAPSAPAADCEPVSEFTTLEEGTFIAAGMNEMPSFLGVTEQGPFQGFNATLTEMFAADNCLEVKWVPSTGPSGTLALTDKKVDALVGIIVKSDARAEAFNQIPNELFFEAAGIMSKEGWSTVDELKGHKIGAVSGSTYINPLIEAVGESNLTQYQSSDAAYEDLAAGRIEAVLTPSVPQGWYVKENPDLGVESNLIEADDEYPLLTQQYEVNWPVVKGNDGLSDAIAEFYDRIHEDGTLEEVLAEYEITDEFYINGR